MMPELQLPLTPPSSISKKNLKSGNYTNDDNNHGSGIVPRQLLPQLKHVKKRPYYSYKKNKPLKNSVLNLNDYDINKTNTELDTISNKTSELKKSNYLKSVLNDCQNIIIVTGAGISTQCGIPDFRSADNGLFTDKKSPNNKSLFDLNSVYSSNEQINKFNKLINKLYHLSNDAEPSPFHHLINQLAKEKRLKRVYTQNIDSLETKLSQFTEDETNTLQLPNKPPYPSLIQLHGTIKYTQCNKCNHITNLNPLDFPFDNENNNNNNSNNTDNNKPLLPVCKQCEEFERIREIAGIRSKGIGYLRPKIILYNEPHPDGEKIADIINIDIKSKKIDCLLIVGTTLKIPGVQQLCKSLNANLINKRKTGKFVVIFICNELPNQNILNLFDDHGIDLIVHGDCQMLSKFL